MTRRLFVTVLLAAALGALAMAIVNALGANPHAMRLAVCKVPVKRWSQLSLEQQAKYVRCNLRHARGVIGFATSHRELYRPATYARVLRQHRRLERKATRNLAAIEAKLHPPFVVSWPWNAIVDCESGDGDGQPPYTAWWGYNTDYEGGPNFTYETWVDYGGLAYASHAYYATPQQQIIVAERVLADVGWGAWPVCSMKVGLR